ASATERNRISTAGRQEFSGGPWERLKRRRTPEGTTIMWKFPGAIQACPEDRTTPALPSSIGMSERLASRSASRRVKIGGMCWTTTIGTGKSLGMRGKTSARALGPPVDVPMATTSMRQFDRALTFETGGVRGRARSFKGRATPQRALILGMSSARTRSTATAGLPVLLGLVA